MELGSSGGVLGQVAPAGVPLAVGPQGQALRRVTYISLAPNHTPSEAEVLHSETVGISRIALCRQWGIASF